jgi:hypothetical protein
MSTNSFCSQKSTFFINNLDSVYSHFGFLRVFQEQTARICPQATAEASGVKISNFYCGVSKNWEEVVP